jgi:hypothetical protein
LLSAFGCSTRGDVFARSIVLVGLWAPSQRLNLSDLHLSRCRLLGLCSFSITSRLLGVVMEFGHRENSVCISLVTRTFPTQLISVLRAFKSLIWQYCFARLEKQFAIAVGFTRQRKEARLSPGIVVLALRRSDSSDI